MALFQPSNMTPSALSGIGSGTVDAAMPLHVSWQVNGTSAMLAYQIVIYMNDTNSTQMYTTGKVMLDRPFYGTDARGNIVFFDADEISADALQSSGITNGMNLKMAITQWWGASASESITQTSASPFITRSDPVLTMDALASEIATRDYTFTAEYSQAQGDSLAWVRWRIRDTKSNILSDTGDVYTALLEHYYDGLFSGENYEVRCNVQTQNGINADTGWVSFSVRYALQEPSGELNVCKAEDKSAVALNWSSVTSIIGTGRNNYHVDGGLLRLGLASDVTWDNANGELLNFVAPWNVIWKGYVPMGQETPILTLYTGVNTLKLTIRETSVVLAQNNVPIAQQDTGMDVKGWWTVIITPEKLYLQKIGEVGGRYPGNTLYPEASLYPMNSVYDVAATWSVEIDRLVDFEINTLVLDGEQMCDYLWVETGVMDANKIQAVLQSAEYVPAWGENTVFLATFADGLNAGTRDTNAYAIYRRAGKDGMLLHLCDLPLQYLMLLDYGARSQTAYTYYLFSSGANTYTSAPIASMTITPVFWDWTVLECSKSEDGTYRLIKEYNFGLNVESGNISNNNKPTLQSNFTPYPTRQATSDNYRSGTLKAYTGRNLNNRYTDDLPTAESIYALSVSRNYKFLKNRKGNLWMIETSAAVEMETGDKNAQQTLYMTMPWVEVGDATDVRIVLTGADPAWANDNVIYTLAELDPKTGMLTWTTPDPYEGGSMLAMNTMGYLLQEANENYTHATMEIDSGSLMATV